MNISLDFDDTATRDIASFKAFVKLFRDAGHVVYIVTMRYEHEAYEVHATFADVVDGIHCTGRKAKEAYMYARGIRIDVWIDDQPRFILMDAHS